MKVGRNNIKEVCPAACPSHGHTLRPAMEIVDYCYNQTLKKFNKKFYCILLSWKANI